MTTDEANYLIERLKVLCADMTELLNQATEELGKIEQANAPQTDCDKDINVPNKSQTDCPQIAICGKPCKECGACEKECGMWDILKTEQTERSGQYG